MNSNLRGFMHTDYFMSRGDIAKFLMFGIFVFCLSMVLGFFVFFPLFGDDTKGIGDSIDGPVQIGDDFCDKECECDDVSLLLEANIHSLERCKEARDAVLRESLVWEQEYMKCIRRNK